MEAYVSNEIIIFQPTKELVAFFDRKLTFDNPEYYKKEALGKWTGGTPKTLSLMKRVGNSIIVPFGMLEEVFRRKDSFDCIKNCVKQGLEAIQYKSAINPYDYQEEAIKAALSKRNGVIVAPCGSGKTQIGLEIIARLGKKALWLTHTADLLKQSMERAKSVFGIDESKYGTITEGKINIGSAITFATVQTMCNIDLKEVRNYFDVIIVDEAHHIVGTPTRLQMFYKVISSLSARYKFGLTATPRRSDGLIGCMYALLGEKVYEVTKKQVESNLCPVEVQFVNLKYTPDYGVVLASDGTLQYTSLITDIVENEDRNKQLAEHIASVSGKGLVLTDRVQHVKTLSNALNALGLKCATLYGSVGRSQRNIVISKLKNGEINLIIATFALAKEGLDIPDLDNVFFTTPQKNETTVVQSAGRVARKAEGKKMGRVYDYVDNFGMLRSWARRRTAFYNKCDFHIA